MTKSRVPAITLRFGRDLLRAVAITLIVTFTTFALMFGNPRGIARSVVGLEGSEVDVDNAMVRLGLDRPLIVQYLEWLWNALQGNLGASYYTGEPVVEALGNRLPVTLSLVFFSMTLMTIFAILLGVGSALFGGWVDRFLQFISVLTSAVPSFVIAIGLVFAFAIAVPLFPATGYVTIQSSVSGWLSSIALPVAALVIASIANAAVQFRGTVKDTLTLDFVRTLRSRGISEPVIIFRHVLRSASGPGLVVISLQLIAALGGAVFVEQIFALPGLGQLALISTNTGDVLMVMGTIVVSIIAILTVNLITDIVNAALNPKARRR